MARYMVRLMDGWMGGLVFGWVDGWIFFYLKAFTHDRTLDRTSGACVVGRGRVAQTYCWGVRMVVDFTLSEARGTSKTKTKHDMASKVTNNIPVPSIEVVEAIETEAERVDEDPDGIALKNLRLLHVNRLMTTKDERCETSNSFHKINFC